MREPKKPDGPSKRPWKVPEPETERLVRMHAEYWSPEWSAIRERYAKTVGRLHIRDDFRIVCDGIVDGKPCGNNIGMAPLPDDHDGLCERCRRSCRPYVPRITTSAEAVDWGPRGDAYEGA